MNKKRGTTVLGKGSAGMVLQSVNLQSGVVISAMSPDAGAKQAPEPLIDKQETGTSNGIHNWGLDNNWPREVRLKVEKSTVAAPLIFKAVCAMYGTGVTYFRVVRDGNKITKVYEEIPEIDTFLQVNALDYIVLERMMDFKYYGNIFQEFIFDKSPVPEKLKIVETHHLETEFCRLEEQNEKTSDIANIHFWGDWNNVDDRSPLYIKIPRVDPLRHDRKEIIKRAGSNRKFAVHSKFPSPGRSFYAMPPHAALYRKNGWLDYSNTIPEIMNAIVENSMNLKYHIQIPGTYWEDTFPNWHTMKPEEQEKAQAEKLEEMNNFLTGKDATMRSFISEFAVDKHTQKEMPGWKITTLDDKTRMDTHLLTSQESDAHIARALNIDPSLAGLQPQGGKMGAGSGSDKRVSFLNGISMSHAEERIIFDFMYIIRDFNGWPKDVQFGFMHEVPTTLDSNSSGVQTM
jgi:hypothetical protein